MYEFQTGISKDGIISGFPSFLEVKLENNLFALLKVNWDCENYDPDRAGEYEFTARSL